MNKIAQIFEGGDEVVRLGLKYVRPAESVLRRSGDMAARMISGWITRAERGKVKALVKYRETAKDILTEGNIKKGSIEDQALVGLLDAAQSGLTDATVREKFNLTPTQSARVIKAAQRLRAEFFDPLIEATHDPTWKELAGRARAANSYISGYFPHIHDLMTSEGAELTARAYMGKGLTSRFLKHREGNPFDTSGISVYEVIDPYAKSMLRTIHDLPAVHMARERMKDIEDAYLRALAVRHIDNYSGKSNGLNTVFTGGTQRFLQDLAQLYYHNLIGLNPSTWIINLTQTMINTWPVLTEKHLAVGITRMLDPKYRNMLREEGAVNTVRIARADTVRTKAIQNPAPTGGSSAHSSYSNKKTLQFYEIQA